MNIIIAGAGKVGFNLAKTLSIGHSVTVIDKNKDALSKIQESLDILPLLGDIRDAESFSDFADIDIDLFIAVSNSDDANVISCMIIDSVLKVKRKFLRVQNSFYKDTNLKEKLNVEELIVPTELSSKSIENLLNYPKINNIKSFKYTNYKLISVFSTKFISSEELRSFLDKEVEFIVGVERDKSLVLSNFYEIYRGDLVYLFVKEESIKKICDILNESDIKEIKNCVVFGASELGIDISKVLVDNKKVVKLIDKDVALCEMAEERLEGRVEVINSKYQTEKLFLDEGLDRADMCVSTYKNDEYNIIKSLEAKEFGIKNIVAINSESEYYNLMHRLSIVALRGPKMSAYHTIMEYISSSGVVLEKYFCGGKGVVFLRKIFENSPLIGEEIKKVEVEGTNCFIIRDDKIFSLDKAVLQQDDIVIAMTDEANSPKVKLWIYEL